MSESIPQNNIRLQAHWQSELARSFTRPQTLLSYLNIPLEKFEDGFEARRLFPMRVPRAFADRMEVGNAHDPLLQQVLPRIEEFQEFEEFSADPLAEKSATLIPGMLHKYQSRVLLIFRGGCAIHCRYCFRRHFPYADNAINSQRLQDIVDYIKAHPKINEVILSGGDPMMASDNHLAKLIKTLEQLPQIKRLRIHSRLLITLPSRIHPGLVTILQQTSLHIIIVVHVNHANEIDRSVHEAFSPLRSLANVTLLNQSVLLRGINDTSTQLAQLSEAVFSVGILPYYLHLLDKVQGSAHFFVDDSKAKQLMRELYLQLPGFLVPKLMREDPNQASKTPIDLEMSPPRQLGPT